MIKGRVFGLFGRVLIFSPTLVFRKKFAAEVSKGQRAIEEGTIATNIAVKVVWVSSCIGFLKKRSRGAKTI